MIIVLEYGIQMVVKTEQKAPGRPKNRLKNIIATLEKGPGTFEELRERVPLARSTLSKGLAELEEQGSIGRRIEPPKERGRGKRHRIIIYLNDTPVKKMLRHLENITEIARLDVGEGEKLLTEDILNAGFTMGTLTTDSKPKSHYQRRKETMPLLDEYFLLRFLARFNSDLYFIEGLKTGADLLDLTPEPYPPEFLSHKKELTELLKHAATVVDPKVFPAFAEAKRTGTLEGFYKFLDWIIPLLEEEFLLKEMKALKGSSKPKSVFAAPWNLAAVVFLNEERNYRESVLFPLWTKKLLKRR
jgi:DNA-binding MarR family transcriptional regulator